MKEDMARNQMKTEMAEDGKHWHVMVRKAGTLLRTNSENPPSKEVQDMRLTWYEHWMRRHEHYVGRRTMAIQGRMKRGRPETNWLNKVRDDIKEKELSEEEVYDCAPRRPMISSKFDPT